jgi:hypothetical protein
VLKRGIVRPAGGNTGRPLRGFGAAIAMTVLSWSLGACSEPSGGGGSPADVPLVRYKAPPSAIPDASLSVGGGSSATRQEHGRRYAYSWLEGDREVHDAGASPVPWPAAVAAVAPMTLTIQTDSEPNYLTVRVYGDAVDGSGQPTGAPLHEEQCTGPAAVDDPSPGVTPAAACRLRSEGGKIRVPFAIPAGSGFRISVWASWSVSDELAAQRGMRQSPGDISTTWLFRVRR